MTLLRPYDPAWEGQFRQQSDELEQAVGPSLLQVHHIGSTAVSTVGWSKPVLDALVVVQEIADLDGPASARLRGIGFEARGEYGIPGRRYFVRQSTAGWLRANVHCYGQGDPNVSRHLAFRDRLRRDPNEAAAYSDLKRRLASIHAADKAAYQAGKAEFIGRIEREWRGRGADRETR